MTRRRNLSSREQRMWQRVTKSVRRLENRHPETDPAEDAPNETPEPTVSRETHHAPKPFEWPKASREDLEKLLSDHTSPTIRSRLSKPGPKQKPGAPGLADRSREKRVQRGKFDIGPSLDLHGHTQDSAKASLMRFVSYHHSLGESSILVITGKGRGGTGILRTRFLEWIAEPGFKSHISGFSRANQKHGGDGAFYLFLRKTDKS
ncbi:Smr/MutS family protein [Ponticaulis sp.]|uniref:Smr/MutS family protein n=1 Tax=Ponticaulis sp. TaxID=2020902 RepID=UPI000B741CDB|nr:Smr/MutS family protein [Ponticaulis sp.]MAI91027.1 hypothetical protein [Ponticaulis sp.]OUX98364.1 MAG: hypothetical protein CBB65_11320 [Hyphomonadaceae bacterium TMED5]|tara:strand:- start:109836 stop:110450 length:615 start_codon:yes stop_codon:yes gene_type:complete